MQRLPVRQLAAILFKGRQRKTKKCFLHSRVKPAERPLLPLKSKGHTTHSKSQPSGARQWKKSPEEFL